MFILCYTDTWNQSSTTVIALASIMLIYSLLLLGLNWREFSQPFQCVRPIFFLTVWKTVLLGLFRSSKGSKLLINWVEVPLFVLSIIFNGVVLSKENTFCLLAWQWQIRVAVLWLSWIEFIFLFTQFQLIGVHALMFIRVLKTIVKFIPLALLLIIAFGLTFHFLLYQPELKV